jgi:pSer/pThr/pTyr-binding forkhead associated (FHA) protein
MYKIVITDDEGKTTLVPFSRKEFIIGRKKGSSIRLTDRNVSRIHAKLFSDDQNAFYFEDLGSRNGIKVDGNTINGSVIKLEPEVRVTVGDYKLSVSKKDYKGLPLGIQMDPKVDKGVGKVTRYPRLVMLSGPTPGLEIPLEEQLYIIGRSDRANVNIDDPSISRAHARIEGGGDSWTISDLDSINGIYINGTKKDDYLLKIGDIIDFGKIQFRFVGAGEPYDYESSRNRDSESDGDERHFGAIIIRTLVVIVLAAMLVAWMVMRRETLVAEQKVHIQNIRKTVEPSVSFDELISQGEARMKLQQWQEAARLFAQAQRINSDSLKARELKKNANIEVEAQSAVDDAVKARDAQQWQEAVLYLGEIPPQSYYYNLSYVKDLGRTLCNELLYKADFMITAGDAGVSDILTLIGTIPNVSPGCLAERDKLEERIK